MKRTILSLYKSRGYAFRILFLSLFLMSLTAGNICEALPAFPGAEGFGAETIGGRGGQIIRVLNLNDSGPGSFREAVEANPKNYADDVYQYESLEAYLERLDYDGHRIVIFEVSGIINLESDLLITIPYITIAGQTSPGGILVTGYQTTVKAHDVIIQHMRFRVGSHNIENGADPETLDSFDIWGAGWGEDIAAYNIIIDHCSFGWGVDETFTISGGVLNTTVQWCIISEGLSHAGHPKGEHSKGLLISGKYGDGISRPTSVSLHHNYIAHNNDRSPQVYSPEGTETVVDAVNNISYNWKGGLSPYNSGSAKVNWKNNYMKQGYNSNNYSFEVAYTSAIDPEPLIYVFNNMGSTRLNQSDPQWNVGEGWRNIALDESYRSITPWIVPEIDATEMSYEYSLEILEDVGATKPVRDSVDERVVADFDAGTGQIIDDVVYPDDFPVFQNVTPPTDRDQDGMPDEWENTHGFNPDSDDATLDEDEDGYTNIEEYLHIVGGYASDSVNPAAVKVFEYGFEDWTGDADTTPGYFSSTGYDTYWEDHKLSTEVVESDNSDCGADTAYEGNYYFHQNFYTESFDPCLGTTPTSINPHTNIGANLDNPSDPKNNFDITSAISSTTMTTRFYFRTTGNWPNAVSNAMKFIRVYGADSLSSSMILLDDDGTSFDITDHPHPDDPDPSWSDYHNIFTAPINWNDGEWHSVVMVLERLNGTNDAPNLQVSAWWDDWDMENPADGSAEVFVDGFGASISHIALFVNWGATYPSSDMGIDMDKVEIWNGIPGGGEDPVSKYDVNGDGTINIQDVEMCVNIILGTAAGNADVNDDGYLNVQDVISIVNVIQID